MEDAEEIPNGSLVYWNRPLFVLIVVNFLEYSSSEICWNALDKSSFEKILPSSIWEKRSSIRGSGYLSCFDRVHYDFIVPIDAKCSIRLSRQEQWVQPTQRIPEVLWFFVAVVCLSQHQLSPSSHTQQNLLCKILVVPLGWSIFLLNNLWQVQILPWRHLNVSVEQIQDLVSLLPLCALVCPSWDESWSTITSNHYYG